MNYYALLVALVLVTALLLRGNQQGNKKFVIVGCFLLFVIYGFRDTYVIGDDSTNTYVGGFLATGKMSWSELMNLDIQNKGYFVFNKIIYGVTGGDYQAYITILSGLVTFCFGFLVYRYSPDPLQSILYAMAILMLASIRFFESARFCSTYWSFLPVPSISPRWFFFRLTSSRRSTWVNTISCLFLPCLPSSIYSEARS